MRNARRSTWARNASSVAGFRCALDQQFRVERAGHAVHGRILRIVGCDASSGSIGSTPVFNATGSHGLTGTRMMR
jgi:hypothetical protein